MGEWERTLDQKLRVCLIYIILQVERGRSILFLNKTAGPQASSVYVFLERPAIELSTLEACGPAVFILEKAMHDQNVNQAMLLMPEPLRHSPDH